jgi:hypothetical protein
VGRFLAGLTNTIDLDWEWFENDGLVSAIFDRRLFL